MANKVIGPKIDRIQSNLSMVWPSNEGRLNVIEGKIPPGPTPPDPKPEDIGNGLKVVENTLMIDAEDNVVYTSNKPTTSNSVFKEIQKADELLGRI